MGMQAISVCYDSRAGLRASEPDFLWPVQLCSHIVFIGLIPSYLQNLSVFDEVFGMTHFRIVVEAH